MRQPGEKDTRSQATRHAVPKPRGALTRVFAVLVLCGGLAAMTAGCAAPLSESVEFASTTGDFAVGTGRRGDVAAASGFLGTGMEGATGPANFADGTSSTVILGAKYFAASGRWCRHYQPLAAAAGQGPTGSTEIACAAGSNWNRVRPVVVTRFSDESRS